MTRGLGCMRLSTAADRDDAHAAAVLDAALAAGVDLLDTADAYAHDDDDRGHNERLVAAAVARAGRRVEIVTKGGLVRPAGAWRPDGRARHLADAARASRDRLGVDAIDLYLLHAVDPRVPLATSVRALARLRDAGVARAIGLCNIGLHQLEAALAIAPIDAVEVELGPWRVDAVRGGLVAACAARGIRVLAHRPLGGVAGARRLARDELACAIATRLGATPAEVALAWLRRLSPAIVPLPGATRIDTARAAGRALELDDDAARALDARWLAIGAAPAAAARPRAREVVMIVGMPAAGKSTLAADHVARGYLQLNRDDRGGSLAELARALDRELAAGADRVVLDNTYPTRASRALVIAAARRHGATVRCIALTTALEDAQANAVVRMLARHGRLLEPDELAATRSIAPGAQFRFRRAYEPPRADEGFDELDVRPGVRAAAASTGGAAIVVELDDLVWVGRPRAATEVALRDDVARWLASWADAGYALAATTWQPHPIDAAALDARLVELVGRPLAIARCRHAAGPPVCWCRKPLPGLALWLAHAHGFALARSVHVGRGPADRGFAARAGLRYLDASAGLPPPPTQLGGG